MKLTFPSDAAITLEKAVVIETSTAQYFLDLLLQPNTVPGLPPRFDPLQMRVEVADSIWVGQTATVSATVRLLYQTSSKKGATPLELASVLSQALADAALKLPPFSFSTSAPVVVFSINQGDNASIRLDDSKGSNYSSKEIGLIVVTVFLSVVLLIVSSVLLYITGGWTVCKAKLTDCLFEEVEEEDEYEIQQQPTFPIQQSEDADEEDEESNITSLPPTSASGILGVSRNKNVPPPLQSPYSEADESSAMYGDGMTPVSNPLGITSMRKLPSPRGGFTGMVMQRMARSATKRK
jgi:hypothetical protein